MPPTDPVRRRTRLPLTLLTYMHTCFLPERPPALARTWLDAWAGVGRIVEGMIGHQTLK